MSSAATKTATSKPYTHTRNHANEFVHVAKNTLTNCNTCEVKICYKETIIKIFGATNSDAFNTVTLLNFPCQELSKGKATKARYKLAVLTIYYIIR